MLDALAPARRRLVLTVIAAACVLALVGAVAKLVSRESVAEPVPQVDPGPVLLVPGYGGSTTALEVLGAALEKAGRDVTIVDLAGDGTGDLRRQAVVLDRAVDRALGRSGKNTVDVVGYSAGGIITRLWVEELGGDVLARRVLTISSPHHGTSVAALASDLTPDRCPEACVQLATESDLLRGLNAQDETPPGPVWVSLWTEDDRTVVPPDSSDLDGALNFAVQSVCPDVTVSHGDMPGNPVVVAISKLMLDGEVPARPGAGLCGRG
jgi:triacylglycerol lipase